LLISKYHITKTLDKPGIEVHCSGMKTSKAMTIRLTEEQAEALETVANVEQRAVSDVIRAAISEHIESRRKDPAFQEDLKARLARARRLLARQAGE
jgi:predicted transcriptional regulator